MKNKMQHNTWTHFAIGVSLVFVVPGIALSEADVREPNSLFAAHDILSVRIEAPMTTLMKERPEDDYLDGTFSYVDTGGREHKLDLKIQTRGRYRRQTSTCRFAPIRLNFRKKQVEGTEFAGQDKLKLVTHCETRRDRYEQLLLREFLAYRFLNALTDKSFGARLMHITYVDTDDDNESITKYGFVIEDEDNLAERLGLVQFESRGIDAEDLDAGQSNLVSVFEYLIGNTDFSLILGPKDDECCHNAVLFSDNHTAPYTPVPYDFDFSGLVDAPYAEPNPRFKLRSVKNRLYRGRCMNNGLLDDTFAYFLEKEGEIRALVANQEGLDERNRRDVERYLDDFFEEITDPKARQRNFIDDCV